MSANDDRERTRANPAIVVGIAASLIILAWVLTPLVMRLVFPDLAHRGQAGDLYGSINALFSGLAFAGVIYAILLQRDELTLQRRELEFTRQELARSASAQEASHSALQTTIYAQTFKVALDILDSKESVEASSLFVAHWIAGLSDKTLERWSTEERRWAETIVRGYDSVGTLIFRGLIPAEYILSTRAVTIAQYWDFLKTYVNYVRGGRADPYFGADFEKLAGLASEFLENAGGRWLSSPARHH